MTYYICTPRGYVSWVGDRIRYTHVLALASTYNDVGAAAWTIDRYGIEGGEVRQTQCERRGEPAAKAFHNADSPNIRKGLPT
jgi:hypothetical protein